MRWAASDSSLARGERIHHSSFATLFRYSRPDLPTPEAYHHLDSGPETADGYDVSVGRAGLGASQTQQMQPTHVLPLRVAFWLLTGKTTWRHPLHSSQ